MEAQVEIVVNGERRAIVQGCTILGLVENLGLDPARLAIELDRSIIKRPEWAARELHPGAALEIVQFVGGG
jgi:thiamine biosynthesis protein ThiS